MNEYPQESRRHAADAFNQSLEQLQDLLKLSDVEFPEAEEGKNTNLSEISLKEWEEIAADLDKLDHSLEEPDH